MFKLRSMRSKIFSLLLMLLVSVGVYAQSKQVSGTVYDGTGMPFPGASVVVAGTTQGTVTDMDGNFSMNVDDAASKTLSITCIGFKSVSFALATQTSGIKVVLEEENIALNEIVAVGYGTQKKRDITGSVASVKADALVAAPVANVTEALTGRMAGVQVTQTEGSPDAEMTIRVRGGGSITGDNTPLYVVDGFPVESISDIAPSDIESIDVLKDASSTAIYGSRGANGVILVTTKSGKEGKVSVSYSGYYAMKKIANTLDVLSSGDYAKWQYELAMLKSGKPDEMNPDSYTKFFGNFEDMDIMAACPSNDWQDLTFGRPGHTWNHSLNINGGSEKFKYAFSYSHMDDKAIMERSSFNRDNLTAKLNIKPIDPVTLEFSARYSETDVLGGGANDVSSTLDTDRRLKYSVIFTPIPVQNLDANAGADGDDLGNLYNPLVAIDDNYREKTRKQLNLAGAVTWEIAKGLKAKTEIGYDDYRMNDRRFWGLTTYYIKNTPSSENQGMPATRIVNTSRYKVRNTNTVNYDFSQLIKSDDHNLNLLVGHEYIVEKQTTLTAENHGFPKTFVAEDAWKLTTQGMAYSIDNNISPDDKLLSAFGRVNYDFQGNYILSATFRADGSSKFSEGNRWGYFPSAAVAWRISSESFMEAAQSWLTDLKIRASFGTAGNNNIPDGQTVQSYASSNTAWINGFNNYWAASKKMANPDLKWETTVTRNVGLDFTLFDGRLSGNAEAYINTTKDLLIEFPVNGTGYDTQYRNMGETENKGLEFAINYVVVDKENFGLNISANISMNRNEIKDLGQMEVFDAETYWASSEIGTDYKIEVGGRVGKMYGYKSAGRYEADDFEGFIDGKWVLKEGIADATSKVGSVRPGMMKLADLDDNGVIDDDDKTIIGDANPLHTGGFNINARVYGFDLGLNFNWSVGNDIYNANKIEFTSTGKYQYRNMIDEMADGKRWTNLRADGTISNDLDELRQMNANTTMWSPYTDRMVFTDYAVEKGSFLRLNTATIGYSLPKSIIEKVKMQKLRIYATAYNVFCLTDYSGFDPEVSTIRKTNLTPGVDYSAYPKSRQFVVGVNVNF